MEQRHGDHPAEDRNGDEPATQRDLATWGGQLTERLDRLEGRMDLLDRRMDRLDSRMGQLEHRMDRLDERMDRQERTLRAVLDIVTESNALLKSLRDLPQRVERLERAVFK